MAKFTPKYPLDDAQEKWVLLKITHGVSVPEIWRMITDVIPGRPVDVKKWDGPKDAFRKKVGRLTNGHAAKNTPPPGSPQQTQADESDPSPIDISDLEGQTLWLQNFVNDSGAKPSDKLRAITLLREWQDRMDDNDPSKAKSDGRMLLSNPLNVKIDAGYITELIMTFRDEIGGLHCLPLNVLNLQELRSLIREAARLYAKKSDRNDLLSIIDDIKQKPETRNQKLFRLRQELNGLTEDEIRTLEKGTDLEASDGED